jgi:hypothetical protein
VKIVSRAEWGARPPKSRKSMPPAGVTHLFLHHAAGSFPSGVEAMRRIQKFHQDSRGWADFAYSFGVSEDGQIFEGRGWGAQGGHTKGWNTRSVAICYLGWGTSAPSEPVKQAILWLADEADRHFGRKLVRQGHRDVGATACPGDGLYGWWRTNPTLPKVEPEPDPYALKPSWVRRDDWSNLLAWVKRQR